jgi:phosphoglycolate phosphatase
MKIEAVIFDLDGTLTDSLPDIVTAANLLLRNHGLKAHSSSDYKKWIGHGAYALLEKALPEKKEGFDLDQLLHEYIDLYGKVCSMIQLSYAGILNLLESLNKKRIPICILTISQIKLQRKL